jgi:hypothetical protein
MKFTQSIISIALISALAACGGSSSKTPSVEPLPEPIPEPILVETVIQGKAIKGTIANAIVTVYKYVDGEAVKLEDAELETASIITEADGSYTITILDYEGPIKVELSVDENTTMICDAPAGCGEVAHGEPIALATVDPTLVLSAISAVGADNAGAANVNVSALTHLATALIEADDSGVNTTSIQTQSSVIANAFNIMGSLTELEPTAVENAASVAGEDNADELRYGLINAGIMAAMFSGEQNANGVLSDRLAEVVEDLIAHDGALLVNQDETDDGFELSLVEVLDGAGAAAVAAAEAIAADSELASQDNSEIFGELEQQETNLENQSEYEVANEGEDGRSEPEVEVPTEGDAIAKAKAMVADVRLFSHLFEVGTDSNTGITTEGDKYVALIDSASVLVEAEAASFLLLADATDAISEISMMFEAGTIAEGTFPIDSFLSIEGAVGSITLDTETGNGGMLFTISANSALEKLALNAAVVFAEDGLSINLNLDGSIESAGAMLSLTEGSFAKVNLDNAINRAALEDDTYEGEITSGELSLEAIIEQKASDTVTDPVAFTGMIKTKLVPVTVHTLNGDKNRRYEKDTMILPEMLTLSGGFSSLTGNLLKATLTVNIQDLNSYEAPGFDYIGKEIKDFVAYTLTDTEFKGTDINGTAATFTVTAKGELGNWDAVLLTDDLPDTPYDNLVENFYSRRFDVELDLSGYYFSYSFDYEESWGAEIYKVTPMDENGDNNADYFTVEVIRNDDGQEYDRENLINEDGNLLLADGTVRNFENASYNGEVQDIEEFTNRYVWIFPIHPEKISSVGDFSAEYIAKLWNSNWYFTMAPNEGYGRVRFDGNEYAALIEGNVAGLPTSLYLTTPIIKDALTVTVSEDENTVTASLGDSITVRTFTSTSAGNFEVSTINTEDDFSYNIIEWSKTTDVGKDFPEVIYSKSVDEWQWHYQVKISPIDSDDDGKADSFKGYYIEGSGFNTDGNLVNDLNEEVFFSETSWEFFEFTSNDVSWNKDASWAMSFNPLTVNSALDVYKGYIVNNWGSNVSGYADGIGRLETRFSEDDLNSIVAGSTTTFDAFNNQADSDESLENENVFLDVNAALSLEAILDDYQVKLMLSGNRTALNDGEFDIEMSYKLPDDENMRKFIAHMKTDEAGSFTVNNSEGVLLIMNDSDDATSDVIGTIVVGSSATKVADIEDRDGVIWFIFTDETTETL